MGMQGFGHIVLHGIVLRETNYKEADKLLTLLTAEEGRLTVAARGARRKNSRFGAACQILCWSEFTVYRGGELYQISQAETVEEFRALRTDILSFALGCFMAEITEALAMDDASAGVLLRHLLNGLYALSALKKPPELVLPAFLWKLLALSGFEPLAERCGVCGRADIQSPLLEVEEGQVVCKACAPGRTLPLCEASLAALRHILYDDPGALYRFRLTPEPLRRLTAAAERFAETHLERGFQTLDYYHALRS